MTTKQQTSKLGPIDVTAEDILAFGAGINDEAAGRTDASHADLHAHPFFAAKLLIPASGNTLFDPKLGIDVQRIVHAGIDLTFHAQVRPGDALSASATLLGIDEKESGKLVSISYEVTCAGVVVADGVTRYFARGAKKGDKAKKPESAPHLTGETALDVEVPTKPDQSLLYAEGSGDKFPIHTDDAFAKTVGLPGVIMHGMCTLALSVNAVVRDLLAGDMQRVRGVSCRFSKILLPGQAIRLQAVRPDGDTIRFESAGPDGKLVISEGVVHLG